MKFFDKNVLLSSRAAKKIYAEIKNLPIIDYHCHLSVKEIADNASLSDIGEAWLKADHYKWRSMRLCGVDETYITGDAPYEEKFYKYAEILPRLAGSPLYYWTHMELNAVTGIRKPLNKQTAPTVYAQANERLRGVRVQDLLKKFRVSYLATTDDPVDDLALHGKYGDTVVAPTFRPDKALNLDGAYLGELARVAEVETDTLQGLKTALAKRLDYFVSKGCKISDHGFYGFPKEIASESEAADLYAKRESLTKEEKEALFGHLLLWLAGEYAKRGILMQLHFAVLRNCNPVGFARSGVDSGYDLPADIPSAENAVRFFAAMEEGKQPQTVIYALNDGNLTAFASLTGAFPFVKVGAAWWFNDTLQGNARTLDGVAQYSALGTSLGMLTDSRSFTSYVRFDFFRRILADYLGNKVTRGEYDMEAALEVAKDIAYGNVKGALKL